VGSRSPAVERDRSAEPVGERRFFTPDRVRVESCPARSITTPRRLYTTVLHHRIKALMNGSGRANRPQTLWVLRDGTGTTGDTASSPRNAGRTGDRLVTQTKKQFFD